jgi:hypothetical protein
MSGKSVQPETPREVWIIDTSSILEVRRKFPKPTHPRIFRALTELATKGALIFPGEVFGELKRGHGELKAGSTDLPFDWASEVLQSATRHGTDYEAVRQALAKAPTVLDTEKTGGADEADPYVLGLALHLKGQGHEVTVVTEDRKDQPHKLSLSTACGLLRLYTVPLVAFLRELEVVDPE